jgi:hypothetical protein
MNQAMYAPTTSPRAPAAMAPGRLSLPSNARNPAVPRVSSDEVGTQQDCRTDRKKIARYPDSPDVTKLVGLRKAGTFSS